MKNIAIILFILLFCSNRAEAILGENDEIYFTPAINAGNFYGVNFDLTYVYDEAYSFQIGYSWHLRGAASTPDDYFSPIGTILFLGLTGPYDKLSNTYFNVGKIIELNEIKTIRANILIGVGITSIRKPTNWEPNGQSSFDNNYTWDIAEYDVFSLVFKPRLEFVIIENFGASLTPTLYYNNKQTYMGISAGIMLGILD